MKRILSWLVIFSMVFTLATLAGCGSAATDNKAAFGDQKVTDDKKTGDAQAKPADSSKPAASGKKYKIATVVKLVGIGWFDRMEEGVKQFAKDTGNEAFMQGPPKADAALQVAMIEDLIAQKPDAICVVPYSPESLEPVLKKARDMGIVVIGHEADNLKNCDFDIEAFDNEAYGAFLMDNLAKAMNYEGEYITTVGNLTNTTHRQWEEGGVKQQLAKYPKMKAVERKIETADSQKNATDIMKQALKAHPNIKGFQGATSQDAPGAALAVEEMGLMGKVFVVGTSLPSIGGKFVKSGSLQTIGFWDPADAGIAMNKLAVMILDGKKDQIKEGVDLGIPGYNKLKIKDGKYLYGEAQVGVNKDNLDKYKF